MRKIYSLAFLCFLSVFALAQTNPTAQALPYTQNFGTAAFSTPFAGMASWTGDGARPYTTQAAAEASLGGADQTIVATAIGTSGGQYGDAPAGNGRLTILQSGNATNGSSQIALAINTTAASTVSISYDLSMVVVNPRDIGVCLQYRNGITGAFTTIAGSTYIYSTTSMNGGDADGATDIDNFTINLPAAATNQAVVQLRWVTWNPTAVTGASRSGLSFDNINVTTSAAVPCVAPTANPTASTGNTTTTTSATFNITAPTTAPNGYIVLMQPGTVATNANIPVNATSYAVGGNIGAATVVAVGTSTAVNVTGLTAGTAYSFFVYTYNNSGCTGGPAYLNTTPLVVNATTLTPSPCATPTAVPTALVLTPASSSIGGSFTASTSANNYLVIRSNTSTLSATPLDGTTYAAAASFGGGIVVSFGAATTFNASGLTGATQYYFFVFGANSGTCTGGPKYFATSLNGNATTTNITGPPAGYYTAANGLTCQQLKTALRGILISGSNVLGYTPGIWNAFNTTDVHRNDANTADIVWDMYSDNPTGPEPYTYTLVTNQCGGSTPSAEGGCYNREHSFPQSWFGSVDPMESDIYHIYPTDNKVNAIRGSYPFGEVGTATTTTLNGSKLGPCNVFGYTGTVFEPINEYKGDLARATLYMATRYESVISGWQNNGTANEVLDGSSYKVFDDWQLRLLYKWHTQDPVSAKEQARNNAAFALQGNRNPFVDSADYVFKIWSCTGVLSPSAINNVNLPSNMVKAFPQPIAQSNFTLQIGTGFTKNTPVRIIDIQGKMIAQYNWPANQTILNINVTNLANGSYVAQIITTKGTINKQLLVAKK